ncbi:uncharacterized protein I206_103528 [Kwoniella pini CBS 10737]|uniref:Hormone-sensitive lipase n=1 Tax=Kwoniella pini CBS 10737 TaxID=1296096 RepID=A0A1B9I9L9_9TREE|nr:hormone-sensitive lipase [Kwoniella pini CBS 10737]OCF52183.1 hormone-sensitive lipase [Kwoniella pini CBS 10737]
MIDHILGRPSPALRRSQIFLVLFFWLWRLYKGDGAARPTPTTSALGALPSQRIGQAQRAWLATIWVKIVGRRMVMWIGKANERLKHFTPYQLILATLTMVYALRHLDDLLGLGAPEPLARLYSRSYYRATYVNTAFDAGFASAMAIRPKWLKDISSMLFTGYYLLWATEGDEVLRRFRAVCSVEMLRVTWEKTKNPYVRILTSFHRPRVTIIRHLTIPRPPTSSRANLPSVKAMLFFDGTDAELAKATEMVIDYPGGGFVAMGPECHEERLRAWAKRTGKPVLGVDYGKAPEYPYPWAIEEGFDAYRTLMETKGRIIGIESGKLGIVLTGDSAGGNICATIMLRILEHPTGIPTPVSMILAYPALDFNFTSWMSPTNLRVLRTEQSETQIPGLAHGKDHLRHKSPLSVVNDIENGGKKRRHQRQKSWAQTLSGKLPNIMSPVDEKKQIGSGMRSSPATPSMRIKDLPRSMSAKVVGWLGGENGDMPNNQADFSDDSDEDDDDDDDGATIRPPRPVTEQSLADRVKTPAAEEGQFLFSPPIASPAPIETPPTDVVVTQESKDGVDQIVAKKRKKMPIGTRLTMTSRSGYFQDRIISPSMMRAMAILYIGPKRNPDFETDYYISPILSPPHLLAHFPPVYLICGERDPFVDDTVIFAGKIREAKKARRAQAESNARGKSARHGEYLQMSTGKTKSTGQADELPDPILRQSDDDWVQMRIIEGWGHGFMQMSSLMREVDPILNEMADWIDESFIRFEEHQRDRKEVKLAHAEAQSTLQEEERALLAPDTHLLPPNSTHVKPSRQWQKSPSSTPLDTADLGSSYIDRKEQDEENSDENDVPEDNLVTFTPKSGKDKIIKRKLPPPSKFNPVPRRPSKERLDLYRSNSMPRFDVDETGSSGEAMTVKTPPHLSIRSLPQSDEGKKGSGAFAFFGGGGQTGKTTTSNRLPIPKSLYGISPSERSNSLERDPSRSTVSAPITTGTGTPLHGSAIDKPKNSLVAAAVAGARAASPALAAAGFVPQKIGDVSEAELMRRRRMEAVYGIGGIPDDPHEEGSWSEGEEDEC